MSGTFIIAEAGVNHNGSIDIARQLVRAAKACGADAVKFQTFKAEKLVTRSAGKAQYQRNHTRASETQYHMLKSLELSRDDHIQLLQCCKTEGILFLSSPFDEESADFLDALGVMQFKIPSGEITNHPFLKHLARKGRPLILSTGMSGLGEVEAALDSIYGEGNEQVTLLHCVTEYPAPYHEINLRAMLTLKAAFQVPVGYSDHTPGFEVAIAAVALGAQVLEKHFTLSKDMEGPDHTASLDPSEFQGMVEAIRRVESSLGNGIKKIAPCERKNLHVARKSLVAARLIQKGEPITRESVVIKRPGNGIQPGDLENVLGLAAARDIQPDEVVTWDSLK